MKKLYFLLSLILSLFISSQNYNPFEIVKGFHANTYGGGIIFQTLFDSNLDHITIGQANGPYKFLDDNITSEGISSLYISKNSKEDGGKIWLKTLDSGQNGELIPNAVTLDSQDNIYVIAAFEGNITLNNISYTANNVDFDQILLKFDSNGNLLWIRELPKKSGLFPVTISMKTDENNLYALVNGESILKFDISTGEKIAEKKFEKLYINHFDAKNDQLFLSCMAQDPVTILNYNFEDFSTFILKTDSNLVATNYLRLFNNNNNGNLSGFNVLISEDNYLYVSFSGYSMFQIIAQSNNGIFTMPVAQNSLQIGNGVMILGKFSMDLSNYKWFYKYPSSGATTIIMNKGRNEGANLTSYFPGFSIGIDNQSLTFNARGSINITSEGHLVSFYDIPTGYNSGGSSKSIDVAYTDIEDYVAIPSDYHASLTFKGNANDNNPLLIRKYSDENLGGSVWNVNLLKTFENGNTYQNFNYSKYVPIFYGTSLLSTSDTNRSISKISPSGSVIWNIEAHEYDDFPTRNYLGNETGINSSEEISYVMKCKNEVIDECNIKASNGEKFSGNEGDFLLSKINSDGHFLFKNKFIPSNFSSTMENMGIFATDSGETILVGLASGDFQYLGSNYSFPTKSMMVCKLNSSGNISYLRSFPYSYNNILIQQDQENNIFLFFNTNQPGILTYDSIVISDNAVNSKAIFLKINTLGQVISGKDFNSGRIGYQPFYINSVCKLSNGFAMYGNTQGNTTPDNIQFTNPYPGNANYRTTDILTKLDNNGNILWTYPFFSPESAYKYTNFESSNIIDKDQEDNIYIAPTFKSKFTYRNSDILMNETYKQSILLKLDGSGNLLSQKPLGFFYSSPILDVYGINKVSILAHVVEKPLDDFDYGYIGGYNVVTLFLEKEKLATQDIAKNIFEVYPNPSSDFININTKEKINSIEIYDTTGRKVISEINSKNQIDVRKLLKGIYYIRVNTDSKNLTSKFIKK